MDIYSLNPQILAGDELIKEKHHRAVVVGLVIACVAVVAVFLSWQYGLKEKASNQPPAQTAVRRDAKAAMNDILEKNVHTVSAQEINQMASILKKTPPTPSAEARATMRNILEQQ